MSSSEPFIRRVELLIGPLSEDQGGGPTSEAFKIESNGDRNSLRVQFDITKTILGSPNVSTIRIWNLSKEARNRIQQTLTRVRLSVGWENTDLSLLASGAVLSSPSSKEGEDIVTEITVMDGYGGTVKGITNQNFAPKQTIKSVVEALAGNLPGVEVGDIEVDEGITIGNGGFVASDRTAEILDELAHQYGFSWSVQNGIFQAIQDDKAFENVVEFSSKKKNLIKATPILTGPMQQVTGAKIQAILNPSILPGQQVDLQSDVEDQLNGKYKAHQIKYSGDTHDNVWAMDIESFKFV